MMYSQNMSSLGTAETALTEQLDQLLTSNHCGAGTVSTDFAGCRINARLASVDRLACELELLKVTPATSIAPERLKGLADQLAEQLSYLEERLIVLEVDPVAAKAQLRSRQPRLSGDTRSYFEVGVGRESVTLQRFVWRRTSGREAVPVALTRSVFVRASLDVADLLSSE